jgi:glutamate-1-semialdehyde 2,1-aminomutase
MELVAPVGPVYQAGTLSANPVGMRAGLATLQKVESANVYEQLRKRTARFCEQLNSDFKAKSWPFQITHTASIFWLHSGTDQPIRRIEQIPAENAARFAKVFHAALEGGVYLSPSGYEVNFVSLAHTDEILDKTHDAILGGVRTACGSGRLASD